MRLIFVRHGEPDYARDCLTETGRRQAAAAAERLAGEGISAVFASPCGRARETAGYTARRLGLPVTVLDFMREITWGGDGIPEDGHPWTLSEWLIDREDFNFGRDDWRAHPYFRGNDALARHDAVAAAFDGFMAERGYLRRGTRYLCAGGREETVALFSHGGSGACALARALALPFPYVCTVLPYDFTSIIALDFPVREGEHVHPRVELFNDIAHLRRATGGPRLQRDSE